MGSSKPYLCLCGCCCILSFLALFSWMVWYGNNILIGDEAFKPGIAIEGMCNVTHRDWKRCNCHDNTCRSKKYQYKATSPACPNVTLSTTKNHQRCKGDNEKTFKKEQHAYTCYINNCESAQFVWEYGANRREGVLMIVTGSIFLCCCVCCGYCASNGVSQSRSNETKETEDKKTTTTKAASETNAGSAFGTSMAMDINDKI